MTMLPDIDQESYDTWSQDEANRQMEHRISVFGADQVMEGRIATLAPPSSDSLTNPLGGGNALPAPPPPPPADFGATPEFLTRGNPAPMPTALPDGSSPLDLPVRSTSTPEPSPLPSPSAPPPTDFGIPKPAAAPSSQSDWIGQAIGAVQKAGGDMKTFTEGLKTSDLIGSAMGAAVRAGADMQTFASSLPALPTPVAPSLASPPAAGGAAGSGGDLRQVARQAAQKYGVDPDVFTAQIQQESGFNPSAKSPAGATGIAQFMPGTAAGMGVDPSDPVASLDGAARLMANHLKSYDGDYSKALAAYNAGPGNVQKYGGVPPFEETQRYVSTILGKAKDVVGGAVSGAASAVRGAADQISQFGNPQLTNDEAYSACGPAAAVRFASMYGRNPTLREATDLAKTVGWSSGQGMAGIGSEQKLMDKLGVPTKLVQGAQWSQFAAEAQTGNPVTISTAGHYYFADGYDPTSGAFHVGRSGTDLKGGSEWMTPAQMEARMGPVQGGLLADNPQVPAPSNADQDSNPLGFLGRTKDAIGDSFKSAAQPLTDIFGGLTAAATGIPTAIGGGDRSLTSAMQPTPSDSLTNPLGTGNAAGSSLAPSANAAPPTTTLPSLQGPAILPSLGDAKDAILRGDAQGALDALGRAGDAVSTSAPAQALTPSAIQQSPLLPTNVMQGAETALGQQLQPGGGLRENVANAPVLGGALGLARGPDLLSQEELLRTPEADTARTILEQGTRGMPVSDVDVAEAARALMTSQAVAMTGKGFGREPIPGFGSVEPSTQGVGVGALGPGEGVIGPGLPGSTFTRRAAESLADYRDRVRGYAEPVVGNTMLQNVIADLGRYPDELAGPIRDLIQSADAPASTVASTVRRWMEENPVSTVPSRAAAAAAADNVVEDLARSLDMPRRGGGGMSGGVPSEQMPLGDIWQTGDPGYQSRLPRGEGEFQPPLLPDEPVGPTLAQQRMMAEQRLINQRRAAQGLEPQPMPDIPSGPVPEQLGFGQRETNVTAAPKYVIEHQPDGSVRLVEASERFLPEGSGEFQPPEVPAESPGMTLEQRRLALEQRLINERRAAEGRGPSAPAEPLPADLTDIQFPDVVPPVLKLPRWMPPAVQDLVQKAAKFGLPGEGPLTPAELNGVPAKDGVPATIGIAEKAGETAERLMKVWKPEDQPALRAIGRGLDDAGRELQRLQDAVKRDPTDTQAVIDMTRQLTRYRALQEAAGARPPQAGVMLKNLVKADPLEANQEGLADIARMAKRLKLKGPSDLVEKLAGVDMSDPKVIADLARVTHEVTFGDRLSAAWYFALLSSPMTHMRNMIGNTITALARPGETAGAAGFDPLARLLLGDKGPRQRYVGEAGHEAFGMLNALPEGVRQGLVAMRDGWVPERAAGGDITQFNREAFRGTPGEFIGYPGRALQAEDTLFRSINEGGSLHGLAYREAKQAGLKGQALTDRIAEIVRSPSDHPEILKELQSDAAYRIFQNKSEFASRLNHLREGNPLLRYLMPFTTTPINVAKFAAERSPLGAGKIAYDLATNREALKAAGSGNLADRMSRAAIGSVVWAGMFKHALDGNVTGRAPSDPIERDAFERQGKQPYAIRNPLSGDWHSYQALSPYSILLSSAADMAYAHNKQESANPEDTQAMGAAMAAALARDLVDQPFSQGLSDLANVALNPQGSPASAWERLINQQAGNLVPGGLRTAARVADDIVRTPKNPLEAVYSNLPGLSDRVAPALNAFGEVRHRPDSGLAAALSPFPTTSATTDPVELELKQLADNNYAVEPGMVDKKVTVAGQTVDLTDDQHQHYQALAGSLSHSLLSLLVGTPEWDAQSNADKQKAIDAIYSKTREAVRTGMTPDLLNQAIDSFILQGRRHAGETVGSATPEATPTLRPRQVLD